MAPVELSTYQYDAQNRLARFQRDVNRPSSGTGDPSVNRAEIFNYSYNTAGKVSGIAYFIGDELALNLTTRYNNANQLEGSRVFASGGGFSFDSNNSFTFSGSNLTTRSNVTRFIARSVDVGNSSSTTTYTYDNKINPFYGTFLIPSPFPSGFFNPRTGPGGNNDAYFGGLFNVFNLSPNNVLSANTTTMYQYEYNSANLPTLRRTIADNVLVQTLRFDYESF